MFNKQFSENEILNLFKLHYNLKIQSIQLLELGADMNALTYKANTDSQSYFVKMKIGNHEEAHLTLLHFLHTAGLEEIIYPVKTTNGNLISQFDQFKMIVYPFIEGKNGFEQSLTKNQWIKLGVALKKIHSLPIPSPIKNQLRTESYSSQWREAVKDLLLKVGHDSSKNEIAISFKNYFKNKIDIINRLVVSAEQLSKQINHDEKNNVLCHSDIHPGNVLLSAEELYIVDWDEAITAPKERDLMFIGGGVGNVWNSPIEVEYFYEGYGKADIDETILNYYRHERILEDIAIYANDLSNLISFNYFKSMFETNGVIDIALKL